MQIKNIALVADKNCDPVVVVTCKADQVHEMPLQKGHQIYICNEFLRSLDLGINVEFEGYSQYGLLIMECAEALEQRNGVVA